MGYAYYAYFHLIQSKSRQHVQSPLLNHIKTEKKEIDEATFNVFLFLLIIFLSSLQKPSTE